MAAERTGHLLQQSARAGGGAMALAPIALLLLAVAGCGPTNRRGAATAPRTPSPGGVQPERGTPVTRAPATPLPEPAAPPFPAPAKAGDDRRLELFVAEAAFRDYEKALVDWTLTSRGWRAVQLEARPTQGAAGEIVPKGDATHLLVQITESCEAPGPFVQDHSGQVFELVVVPECEAREVVAFEGAWKKSGCGTIPPRRAWFAVVAPGARLLAPVPVPLKKRRCLEIQPSQGFVGPP